MMDRKSRHIATLLLGIFALFFSANHLFYHSHLLDDGTRVYHSHPFLPGGQHTHSTSSLAGIAAANEALTQSDRPTVAVVPHPITAEIELRWPEAVATTIDVSISTGGRAPPSLG